MKWQPSFTSEPEIRHQGQVFRELGRCGDEVELVVSESSQTGYHGGYHRGEYFEYVREKLRNLEEKNLKGAALVKKLGQIETQIRSDLINGKMWLQYNDPTFGERRR